MLLLSCLGHNVGVFILILILILIFHLYLVFWVNQGATLSSLSHEDMLEAKQLGYSDIQISQRMGTTEDEVCDRHPCRLCTAMFLT